jgi:hypothetical protein
VGARLMTPCTLEPDGLPCRTGSLAMLEYDAR